MAFGGLSRHALLQMAQGIASMAAQISLMSQLEEDDQNKMKEHMRSEGNPASINELVHMAAAVIAEHRMGWYKRNQFLGAIYGRLLAMGINPVEANSIKTQIELLAH